MCSFYVLHIKNISLNTNKFQPASYQKGTLLSLQNSDNEKNPRILAKTAKYVCLSIHKIHCEKKEFTMMLCLICLPPNIGFEKLL